MFNLKPLSDKHVRLYEFSKSEDCQNKNNVAACCFLMWWNFVKRDKWLYVVIGMP